MKPKSPKDSKRKPKEVSGKVKKDPNGYFIQLPPESIHDALDAILLDTVIDMGDMELTGYHNGIPVYTPKINTKDID